METMAMHKMWGMKNKASGLLISHQQSSRLPEEQAAVQRHRLPSLARTRWHVFSSRYQLISHRLWRIMRIWLLAITET